MKLIIQIPCYNEEVALPVTLSQLPTEIEGIDIPEGIYTVESAKAEIEKLLK